MESPKYCMLDWLLNTLSINSKFVDLNHALDHVVSDLRENKRWCWMGRRDRPQLSKGGLACDACRGFSTEVLYCIVYKDTRSHDSRLYPPMQMFKALPGVKCKIHLFIKTNILFVWRRGGKTTFTWLCSEPVKKASRTKEIGLRRR